MKFQWTIIDRYIFRRMMVTFIYALILFNLISVVFDFVEHVDDFDRRHAPASTVLLFLLSFFPWISGLLSHLFLFISVIFFTSRMASKTEIIPILANGISFSRFLRPYMVGAAIIFVVLLFAKNYTIPMSNKVRFAIKDRYLSAYSGASEKNKHLRIGPRDYAYTESYDKSRSRADRFTLFSYDSLSNLSHKTESVESFYDSTAQEWIMKSVTETYYSQYEQRQKKYDTLRKKLELEPQDFFEEVRPREEYTSSELKQQIAKSKRLGLSSYNVLYVELYKRTAEAFAVFIFVLIGACIGAQKTRGGSGIHLALGIVICLIYIFLQRITSIMSIASGLDPLIAAWIPNVVFALIALYFYRLRSR